MYVTHDLLLPRMTCFFLWLHESPWTDARVLVIEGNLRDRTGVHCNLFFVRVRKVDVLRAWTPTPIFEASPSCSQCNLDFSRICCICFLGWWAIEILFTLYTKENTLKGFSICLCLVYKRKRESMAFDGNSSTTRTCRVPSGWWPHNCLWNTHMRTTNLSSND